jgi:hypothetical protein
VQGGIDSVIFGFVNTPRLTLSILDASEPLRKRAPITDADGKALSDFMVIFPGLRKKSALRIQNTTNEIHTILSSFGDTVVFAELNLALNLLWVSIRPVAGIRFEIAEALRSRIPSARLVSHL